MAKNENDRIIDTPETASAGRASYYSSGSTSSSSTVADHTHTTALNQGGSSLPLYLPLTGGTLTGALTLPNTGLHILDTDASHDLIVAPGSDLTADRTLTVTTGDADRTLTVSGDATVDQDVSTTGTPSFAGAALTGGFILPIVAKTADYTLTAADYTCLVTASSVNITITLPAAASHSGRVYNVKKLDATGYSVIVDGNASETIDGVTTKTITSQYDSLSIQSDGTNWHIL